MKTQLSGLSGKIFLIIVIMLFFREANAQHNSRHIAPRLPDSTQIVKIVDELTVELKLSNEQKSKISSLYFNHFSELKRKQEDKNRRQQKEREQMHMNRKRFENQIKKELTTEQQIMFDEFVKNKTNHKRGMKNQEVKQ